LNVLPIWDMSKLFRQTAGSVCKHGLLYDPEMEALCSHKTLVKRLLGYTASHRRK
jgi:hypothetical protein